MAQKSNYPVTEELLGLAGAFLASLLTCPFRRGRIYRGKGLAANQTLHL